MTLTHSYFLRSSPVQTDSITEIIPNKLYLGNKKAASDHRLLSYLGITHILNATKEVNCHFPSAYTYLQIPLSDGDSRFSEHLTAAESFIKNGLVVLVHCAEGISRSASLVIAYLMRTNKWDFKTSLDFVKEKRPKISPHFCFQAALDTGK